MTRLLALATVLGLLAPCVAPAAPALALRPPRLEVDRTRAALITGAALALWGAGAVQRAAEDDEGCSWCEPGGFDEWARGALRWSDNGAAGDASDVALYAVTFGSTAAVAWLASREGDRREVIEDVFLVVASIAVADGLTRVVQHGADRLRPYAWASGGTQGDRELRAFFSGHASRAFAAAAAATQVLRLRGRRGWPWVAAAGFTVAAATGWLRVAADQHWATDVLAAAAVGTAIGWAVPTLSLRPVEGGGGVTVVPAPGGLAIVF